MYVCMYVCLFVCLFVDVQFPANCRAYAVIRETDEEGAVTVCGGGSRARTVYVSRLNHVELQMVTNINNVANNYVFLFLYEGEIRILRRLPFQSAAHGFGNYN